MKNYFSLILILFLSVNFVWAQCPTGDLDFMTQQQVDDFAVQYPNCTQFPGTMTIMGDDIFDLRAFSNLTAVAGSVLILGCPNLTHTTGFEHVTDIGGSLIIDHNPALTDLYGFAYTSSVVGNLTITNNASLSYDCFWSSICSQQDGNTNFYVQNNGEACDDGDKVTYTCIDVLYNPPCNNDYVQNLTFTSQAQLDEFNPLCIELIGNVTISGNDITNLGGLSTMTTIIGELTITNNPILASLEDLSGLNFMTLTHLTIENNPSLTTCGTTSLCRYIGEGGSATINNNAPGCASLAEVTALCNQVNDCPAGVHLFTQADVDNFSTQYPNCTILSGALHIGYTSYAASDITDLSPLSQLTEIYEGLTIKRNTGLASLNGLENLTSIGKLRLINNDNLADISSLSNITSTIRRLSISNNSSLNECSLAFICDYLDENELEYGETIDYNGTDCNSEEDILENCMSVSPNCPSNDVTLTNQQQVNDFATLYPNCTEIAGLLQIGQSSGSLTNITDLSPLSFITSVGDISVERTQITNLNGLEGLQLVDGDMKIILNPNLNSINALNGLSQIDGQLHIGYNKELTDLTGLNQITSLGSLRINNNNKLLSLSGLNNLQTVLQVTIQNNPLLTSLDDLSSLLGITGLTITSNPQLAACSVQAICDYLLLAGGSATILNNASGCNSTSEIEAACAPLGGCPFGDVLLYTQAEINSFGMTYPNCTEIEGNLILGSSGSTNDINDLSPLSQIVSVNGWLNIVGTQLTDLSGLEQLQETRNIFIEFNTQLTNLHALSGITSLENGVSIRFNRELTDLQGLEQLTELAWLNIFNNKKLQSLTALSNLTTVHTSIIIENNEILPSLEGIENADLTAMDLLRIIANPQLTTCGYDNICNYIQNNTNYNISNNATGCNSAAEVQQNCTTTIQCPTGDVTLMTQQQVNDFATAYPNCTEIDGMLYIGKTSGSLSNINNLTPLNQIESVGGISIQRTNITDLSGLEQLQTVTGDLQIVLNPNLLNINALNGITSVGGQVHIGYNKELVALTGLNQLNSVGSLRINNNKKLANLSALMNLQTAPEIIIQNNNILASLTGLESLNAAQLNNLTITSNPLLSDCAVNSVCEYLDGQGANLIANNAAGCATAPQVEDLCMPSSSCTLADIFLLNQQEVNDFAAMYSNCSVIDGNIFIGQNSGNLNNITDLSPLSFITEVKTLGIRRTNLTDLSGLEQLESAENIEIELNPSLTNINALANLNTVEDELYIGFNKELLTLDGLEGLNSVGVLYIKENKKLMSLEALSNLTEVAELLLNRNLVLTSLAGLENINPANIVDIELSLNPLLTTCGISPICTLLIENPNLNYWIISNGEGCSSALEIVTSCAFPPDDGCESVTETQTFTFDDDLCIDGVGFSNNPNITFTDPGTPADAILQNAYFEVYLRLKEGSCEEDFVIRVTDPAGNTETYPSGFLTCVGSPSNLYHIVWSLPSTSGTNGNMDDWLIEFDDTNDQNAGDEYSVRFARLTYTAITSQGGTIVNNQVSDFADFDLFIDGTGFANNDTYTFTDPGTPADATLSNISLELYFKLNGNSCENEIAIQITDPAGNTQPLTAFTTCIGGTDLYYVDLDVPSGNTTGSPADWIVEFDDTNDQNTDYEYSVRFGRLTYDTEYVECMEMLTNENGNESHQPINATTQQLVNHDNSSTHQLVNSSLKLYPVPASQHLNVEYFSENNNAATIQIISNEGKILRSQEEVLKEGMNTIQLDITDIPVGYYFIRMYGADAAQTQPFVKIRP